MFGKLTGWLLLALFVVGTTLPIARAEVFRLAPGDVLNIGIWGLDGTRTGEQVRDQLRQVPVRPDGNISIPLIGEVKAAGRTVTEVTQAIEEGMSLYMKAPKVFVNLNTPNKTRVYVLGEVTKPGVYEIEKQHNILDAIGMAGGYTKDTAKRQVFVIRQGQTDKPQKVDLLDLLKNGNTRQNIPLNDGDVVYLTTNGRIDISRDVVPWLSSVYYIKYIADNN